MSLLSYCMNTDAINERSAAFPAASSEAALPLCSFIMQSRRTGHRKPRQIRAIPDLLPAGRQCHLLG
tara:strand:- start:622 stop:822 length:201 start_codon:yes stop_codon:yes gene_type:complete